MKTSVHQRYMVLGMSRITKDTIHSYRYTKTIFERFQDNLFDEPIERFI